ncbi:hypothetical protein BJ165DRAFT_1408262 [Panaeolus papilionaceus]|nr:hypothetical protein BJ165DRAFT_1408262 [Panaeolus papilionaceus]
MKKPYTPEGRVGDEIRTADGKFKLATRSPAVLKRIRLVAPHQGLCIIEHTPSPTNRKGELVPGKASIQLCHTFGRANSLDDSLMTSAFDPDMMTSPIYRNSGMILGVWAGTSTRIDYPYNKPDIFKITTHIHPKFAILHAGNHLVHRVTEDMREQPHVQKFDEELKLVRKLYTDWTAVLTDAQRHDPSFIGLPREATKKSNDDKTYHGPRATSNSSVQGSIMTRGSARRSVQSSGDDVEDAPALEDTETIALPMPVTPLGRPIPNQSETRFRKRSKRVPVVPAEYDAKAVIHDGSDDEVELPDGSDDEDKGEEKDAGEGQEDGEDEGTGPKVQIKGDYGRGASKLKRRCKSPLTGCVPEEGSPCAKVVKKARLDTNTIFEDPEL